MDSLVIVAKIVGGLMLGGSIACVAFLTLGAFTRPYFQRRRKLGGQKPCDTTSRRLH